MALNVGDSGCTTGLAKAYYDVVRAAYGTLTPAQEAVLKAAQYAQAQVTGLMMDQLPASASVSGRTKLSSASSTPTDPVVLNLDEVAASNTAVSKVVRTRSDTGRIDSSFLPASFGEQHVRGTPAPTADPHVFTQVFIPAGTVLTDYWLHRDGVLSEALNGYHLLPGNNLYLDRPLSTDGDAETLDAIAFWT